LQIWIKKSYFYHNLNVKIMANVAFRTITNTTTTIPAPIAYPASGQFQVIVDSQNSHNLQYTGASPLDNFGTPPSTGTVEPIIIGGETGINPYATGKHQLGYTYLFISGFSSLVKVLGIQFLSNTSGTYRYLIQTDTDCTSISTLTNFQIVFAKLTGYQCLVTGATAITANGVSYPQNATFSQANNGAEGYGNGFVNPVLIVASGSTAILAVTENS
jgi:hypothetical protein